MRALVCISQAEVQPAGPCASIGGTVSMTAEMLQTGISIRVASLTDVMLNVVGTAVGGILVIMLSSAGGSLVRRLRRELWIRPARVHAIALELPERHHGAALFGGER